MGTRAKAKRAIYQNFARRLTAWMDHRRLRSDDLAKLVGVKVITVQHWRAARSVPRLDMETVIMAALRTTRAEFWDTAPPDAPPMPRRQPKRRSPSPAGQFVVQDDGTVVPRNSSPATAG